VLESVSDSKSYEFANAFCQAAEEARTAQDTRAEAVYRLLTQVCSLHLDPRHPRQPFRAPDPAIGGTADALNLGPEALSVLGIVAPSVLRPWLRARIADVVWTFQRDHRMARLAVQSYLELTNGFTESEPWPKPIRALERAVEIALRLGPKGGLVEIVSAHVEDSLSSVDVSQGLLAHALLTLCAKYKLGDPGRWHGVASAIAGGAEHEADWSRAETYWMVAEDFAVLANDEDKRRVALERQGESYVSRAEEVADRPHIGKLQAAGYLQRAVEAFRRASMRERSEQVQRLLMEYQRAIPGELIPVRSKVNIGPAIEASQNAVSGKTLQAALLELALLVEIPEFARLRHAAEQNVERFKSRQFFPAEQLNSEGKVVGREQPKAASEVEAREAAIRVDMVQSATREFEILAQAVVLPALRRIAEEHVVRTEDFFWLVSNNPFVPPGRELLYADAFQAAFEPDITKAIHILVLQAEHSIRELLERRDVLVTSLKDGIQMERGLNQLLYHEELTEVLGEDTAFALQCLLVEKFGSDLRNRVAHGLMDSAAFRRPECFYCWGLFFRIVCEPIIAALRDSIAPADSPGAEEGPSRRTPDGGT
jgi:hypothetical protein